MCEIFPEVQTCCLIIDLRLGMLLISVVCIMTGVLTLTIVEQKTNASFSSLKNVTDIDEPKKAVSGLSTLIPTGLSIISVVFMVGGVLLLFGNLTDQEGIVQMYVWLIFINVLFGYLLVIMVAMECLTQNTCLLSEMDWLSGSALLVIVVGYLTLWVYFVTVANSYVVNATG